MKRKPKTNRRAMSKMADNFAVMADQMLSSKEFKALGEALEVLNKKQKKN